MGQLDSEGPPLQVHALRGYRILSDIQNNWWVKLLNVSYIVSVIKSELKIEMKSQKVTKRPLWDCIRRKLYYVKKVLIVVETLIKVYINTKVHVLLSKFSPNFVLSFSRPVHCHCCLLAV